MGNKSSKKKKQIQYRARDEFKQCKHQILANPPKIGFEQSTYSRCNADKSYTLFLCTHSRRNHNLTNIETGLWKYESKSDSWSHLTHYFKDEYKKHRLTGTQIIGNTLINDKLYIFSSTSEFVQYNLSTDQWFTDMMYNRSGKRLKQGVITAVTDQNEVHFMGHSGLKYDDGRHVIYKTDVMDTLSLKPSYTITSSTYKKEYDAINYETQVKDNKLVYCAQMEKLFCIGGKLLDISDEHSGRSDADTGNYLNEKGKFYPVDSIWSFKVGDNENNEW